MGFSASKPESRLETALGWFFDGCGSDAFDVSAGEEADIWSSLDLSSIEESAISVNVDEIQFEL